MLFKLLLLGLVIWGVYHFFIKQKPIEHKDKEADVMVECDKCGTYVSNKEAIIKDGKYYCSKKCAGVEQ